jgi:hypothetical protein
MGREEKVSEVKWKRKWVACWKGSGSEKGKEGSGNRKMGRKDN